MYCALCMQEKKRFFCVVTQIIECMVEVLIFNKYILDCNIITCSDKIEKLRVKLVSESEIEKKDRVQNRA